MQEGLNTIGEIYTSFLCVVSSATNTAAETINQINCHVLIIEIIVN